MPTNAAVEFSTVGRKPSKNPKAIHLGLRIEQSIADALDAEVDRLRKATGLSPTRSDVVRLLVNEALATRAKRTK